MVELATKIKVAIIAPEFLPNWGGIGTYCVELAKHLSENKGIEVHVVTLARHIRGSNIEYSESDILNYFDNKISLHVISKAKETFLYNMQFQYDVLRKLPKIVKENKIELLHSQHAHMPDIMFKIRHSSQCRIPTITTVHSTVKTQYDGIKAASPKGSEMDPSEKYELALYPMLLLAEKFYLMKRNLIFVSRWTKKHVEKSYNISNLDGPVIHNGVDTNRFEPGKMSDSKILNDLTDPIILYASRLTVARGAHVLAHAIPKILNENKRVHFVFAGSGNKKPLLDILRSTGVPKNKYTLLGYVDYKDLPSLYSRAYAYVMPTSWENLPFKLLEAMSCGKPVLTTSVGGIPEVVQNGYNGIFTIRDPMDVAEKITYLLEDEQFAKMIGNNARKTILKNFTWAKTTQKTKIVYDRLLDA